MNLDDQPEWIHARQAKRRAAFERQQVKARREAARQVRGVPVSPLPTIEEDEARIAKLTKLRKMKSEPAASTAAELVWRLITGAGDAPGLDILATNLSEVDKISHYESLRKTDIDAASRFGSAVGIQPVKVILMPDTHRTELTRKAFITEAILADVKSVDSGQLALDYAAYLVSSSGFGSSRVLIRKARYNYAGSDYYQAYVSLEEPHLTERYENMYRVGDY